MREHQRKAASLAVAAFAAVWLYGWAVSHLSEAWLIFSFVPLTAGVVVFITKGGLDDA